MRRPIAVVVLLLALAAGAARAATSLRGQGDTTPAPGRFVAPGAIRSPKPGTTMDTNPANLASAVVTHAFGQLPKYIDGAAFRLLPYDMFRAFEPGRTLARTFTVTTPRTNLVLDTVVTSAATSAGARVNARAYSVAVALDGRLVRDPGRYWLYYRNNGPQICRIYYPGDLGSLHMAAHSLVLLPLAPGPHLLRVTVAWRAEGGRRARIVTRYLLHVLPRAPNAAERASAPEEDAPKPDSSTPLVLRKPGG